MAKQLLIGPPEEIWMEVRSTLGVAWHGSRHLQRRHPTSRDQRRVHWASASLQRAGNLVFVDEEDHRRQSAVKSWEENTSELPRTLTACVLDAKMGGLKKYFSS